MSVPKVTIVIPTRERPDTLAHSLRTALNQDWPNLEIIVSDNASSPATAEVVQSLNDPRITYKNPGRRLSMSHNWEFAIADIKEGWVTLIGDDDGLLPNSLGRVVNLVESQGLEMLISQTCTYNWPSRREENFSVLTVPMRRRARVVKSKNTLRQIMNWDLRGIVFPHLYTGGLVSASVINRIRDVKGSFFQSQIPDFYSAFAIMSVVDRYLHDSIPFSIGGASSHSNGVALHNLKKTEFLNEDNIPFHRDIILPKNGTFTFSMPAMVCESILQSAYLGRSKVDVSPQRIMYLIMKYTGRGESILLSWAEEYAKIHNFDPNKIISASTRLSVKDRYIDLEMKLSNMLERYRIATEDGMQINNVFEASIAAATILTTRPNRYATLSKTFWRALGRNMKAGRSGPVSG